MLLFSLPALAGLGLGPVLLTGGRLGSPVLVLSNWLSAPILNHGSRLVGRLLVPVLLLRVLFLAVVHGDLLSGVVGRLPLVLFLLSNFLEVSVEEEIGHDAPVFTTRQLALEALHFASQKPVDQTDAVGSAVVARDDDVDVLQRAVGVAQRNHRDVNVAGLADGLVINERIGDDDQPWLTEAGLRVIRERTGAEAAVVAGGTDELGALDAGALAHVLAADDAHVLRVVNGGNDARRQLDLFPEFLHIENVRTTGSSLENVLLHLVVAVGVAEVALGGQNLAGVRRLEL